MPRVIIMRHGEAEAQAESDALRNLTDWGKKEAHASGKWLLKQGIEVENIVASPYRRAQQTAQIMQGRLGYEGLIESVPEITPDGLPEQFLAIIESQGDECTLFVAHNPLVTLTLNLLVDANPRSNRYVFATASLAVVEMDVVGAGLGVVKSWYNPEI